MHVRRASHGSARPLNCGVMRTIELALRPEETLLVGSWVLRGNSMVGDTICGRIETLLANVLVHIADDPKSGGWESLFRDPSDGRFWERFYPQSEMHGGGPRVCAACPLPMPQ